MNSFSVCTAILVLLTTVGEALIVHGRVQVAVLVSVAEDGDGVQMEVLGVGRMLTDHSGRVEIDHESRPQCWHAAVEETLAQAANRIE